MNYYLRVITAFIFTMQAAEAATLQIGPQVSTVEIGDTLTLDIIGTDFPETQGGGFSLSYDEEILNITNVTIDEANTWTFVNDFGTIDNTNGELNEVRVSDFPGVTGGFTVATIEFLATGLGTSTIELTESIGNPWASSGSTINPTLSNSSSVQVVPIPAAIWLFGTSLLGLVGMSMRRVV
jgi:hypothetical protein